MQLRFDFHVAAKLICLLDILQIDAKMPYFAIGTYGVEKVLKGIGFKKKIVSGKTILSSLCTLSIRHDQNFC